MSTPAENLRAEERLLTFEVAGDFYAMPIAGVLEVAEAGRMTCIPTLPTRIGGVINHHGDALPVINCASLFEVNEAELGEPADHERRVVAGFLGEREIGETLHQTSDRCSKLQPCQRSADAEVDAATESDVRSVVAADVETIRGIEATRIPLCGAEEHRDLLADTDLLARDLDPVVEHPPLEHLQR